MKIEDAKIKRILKVSKDKKMSICDKCLKDGMSLSNIYDLIHKRTEQDSKITLFNIFVKGLI